MVWALDMRRVVLRVCAVVSCQCQTRDCGQDAVWSVRLVHRLDRVGLLRRPACRQRWNHASRHGRAHQAAQDQQKHQ